MAAIAPSLAGATPGHRLFFALPPPPHVVEEIAVISRLIGTRDGQRSPLLHLPLLEIVRLDRVEPALIACIATTVPPLLGGCAVALDRIATLSGKPGAQPIVLQGRGNPGLQALTVALGKGLGARGLPPGRVPGRITPHVTVAHGRARAGVGRLPNPVRWTARELVLIDARIGLSGQEVGHEVVARFPLAGVMPD